MVEETIRHSEEELLGFISSTQDEELSCARTLAIDTVDNSPGMRVWAFEDAPASSERARDRYIRNAGRADLVIWLIGSTTTTPIVEEISACMRAQGNLLAFKLPARNRDNETDTLIRRVSDYATWKTVEKVEDLPAHIKAALTDEMLRRYRDPAPSQPRPIPEAETPRERRGNQASLDHAGSCRTRSRVTSLVTTRSDTNCSSLRREH